MDKTPAMIWLLLVLCLPALAQTGRDTLNRVDDEGRKQGYWKKYNEDGMILYEGTFESDIPVGEFTYFYPDGTTKARSAFSVNGRRTHTITYHYSGKVMSEGFYVDQQKDSTWRYYYNTGTLLKEEFYRDNMKNGTWRSFFGDGQVAEEVNWKDDRKNGPWIQYYPDGTRKLESHYADDEQEGPVVHYHPSGRARITGQYSHSIRTGTWYYMNDSSRVVKAETYEEGKLVKEEDFRQED